MSDEPENPEKWPKHKRRRPSGGRPWTPEVVRERIRVSWLVRRLQLHVAGKLKRKLDMSQIRAAEILLARSLPTLTQTDLNVEASVRNSDISDKPMDIEEWAKQAEAERDPKPTH